MSLLPLLLNRWSAFLHDLLWIPTALLLAFWVRLEWAILTPDTLLLYGLMVALFLPVQAATFIYCGLYRGIWRFASLPDLMRILRAVAGGTLTGLGLLWFFGLLDKLPPSILLSYPVFLIMGLTTPRLFYRWFKDHNFPALNRKRALILGAGRAGELLVRELIKSREYLPVGFLDDDPAKLGRDLHGVPVLGTLTDLDRHLRELNVDILLIGIRTAGPKLIRHIVDTAAFRGVNCITLPSLQELTDTRVEISRLREVDIEDLLGREEVAIDNVVLHAFLRHKRVLITGAGGSIGSELCRQVMRYQPAQLIMLDHWEYGLYSIEHTLKKDLTSPNILTPVLGSVSDETRMRYVFATYRPQVVFHAAAYKHVPLLEDNAIEGVRTNIFGTRIVADLAASFGSERLLLVSTDKAVKPTNVMGASKRVAELYCQSLRANSSTAFIITRFGNVMGSAGSVVPLFRNQIEMGGPVTVTHPDITRYFMTIPEAVSLILQAACMGRGGEIFVLDMGKPLRILDLAKEMIRLSGHEPERDIEISFIGLRPGEKLHEELFYSHENTIGTRHPKILRAEAEAYRTDQLRLALEQLKNACATHDEPTIQRILQTLVPEFNTDYPVSLNTTAQTAPVLKIVAGNKP